MPKNKLVKTSNSWRFKGNELEYVKEVLNSGFGSSTSGNMNQRLEEAFAKRFGVVVTGTQNGIVRLACRRISQMAIVEARRFLGQPISLDLVTENEFELLLQQLYEGGVSDAVRIADDIEEDLDLQSIARQLPEPADLFESEDDAPIIRLINGLLTEAIKKNASDIHIEPFERDLRVRFRIDGTLCEVLRPAKVLAPLLVSRIKVLLQVFGAQVYFSCLVFCSLWKEIHGIADVYLF